MTVDKKAYTAILTDPSGHANTYEVYARNKTEARKAIRQIYQRDTPPPSAGFYAFEQCRLVWDERDEHL